MNAENLKKLVEQAKGKSANDFWLATGRRPTDVIVELAAALEGKDQQLARYSVSPGQADQRLCESRVVREILGFSADSIEVSPADLKGAIEVLKESIVERNERIAELERKTEVMKAKYSGANYRTKLILEAKDYWVDRAMQAEQRLQQPIKLPDEKFCPAEYEMSLLWSETETWNKAIAKCAEALRAQGFKVEGE